MANSGKVLQVRLQEKIDTLENWLALDTDATPFKPLAGEKINVKVPTANSEADGESVGYEIITKTGDGSTRFKELPWDSALAADVYDWAKAATKPSYTYSEISGRPTLVNLTIKANDDNLNAVAYDPDGSAKTLTVDGSLGIRVKAGTANSGKLTIEGQTATSSEKGMVLSGGDITVASNGAVTVNHSADADHADSADDAAYAANAGKLVGTDKITGVSEGSTTQPVYFKDGVPTKISYTISKSVPSGAIFTDEKVKATAATTTKSYITGVTGAGTAGVNYDTGVYLTTTAGQLHADSLDATAATVGALTVTGNESVGGTLTVTGKISSSTTAGLSISGNAATATKVNKALTFGNKTFDGSAAQTITAADLGLSTALKFKGVVDDISTVTSPAVGDVWLVGDKEYVYVERADGTKNWEDLGDASALTDAVASLGAKTVGAGNGLTGGGAISGNPTLNVGAGVGIAVAADAVKAKLRSETALTVDSAAATTTSGRVYPVAVDKTGYLAVNVPWTDKSVTSAANHYTPATDTNSALNAEATSTTAATWGSTDIVTGVHLQRDSKGHVTGMTVDSIQMPSNPNTDKTKVTAGIGLAGGGSENSSTGVTVKAKLRSETALTEDSAAAAQTSGRIYPVVTDKSGYLAVNVPWSNTTYNNATTSAAGLMSAGDKTKLDGIATGANKYSLASSGAYTDSNATYTFTLTPTVNGTAGTAMSLKVPAMVGATSSAASKAGLVPLCTAANRTKFLRGDGTWVTPTNTTYNPFTTAAQGLVNASGDNGNILFGDNTWHGATDYIVLCAGSASVNV